MFDKLSLEQLTPKIFALNQQGYGYIWRGRLDLDVLLIKPQVGDYESVLIKNKKIIEIILKNPVIVVTATGSKDTDSELITISVKKKRIQDFNVFYLAAISNDKVSESITLGLRPDDTMLYNGAVGTFVLDKNFTVLSQVDLAKRKEESERIITKQQSVQSATIGLAKALSMFGDSMNKQSFIDAFRISPVLLAKEPSKTTKQKYQEMNATQLLEQFQTILGTINPTNSQALAVTELTLVALERLTQTETEFIDDLDEETRELLNG